MVETRLRQYTEKRRTPKTLLEGSTRSTLFRWVTFPRSGTVEVTLRTYRVLGTRSPNRRPERTDRQWWQLGTTTYLKSPFTVTTSGMVNTWLNPLLRPFSELQCHLESPYGQIHILIYGYRVMCRDVGLCMSTNFCYYPKIIIEPKSLRRSARPLYFSDTCVLFLHFSCLFKKPLPSTFCS